MRHRMSAIGRAAHRRVEQYILGIREDIEALKRADALAEEYYRSGNLIKAKELSQKIEEDAILKPLTVTVM